MGLGAQAGEKRLRHVFMEAGDNSISVYDKTDPRAVSQRADFATPPGQGNNLHVLNVGRDGRLAETEPTPLALPVPAATRPQGLATF
jgi:hypothetical protein